MKLFILIVNSCIPYLLSIILYSTVFRERRRYSNKVTAYGMTGGILVVAGSAVLTVQLPASILVVSYHIVVYLAIPFLCGLLLFRCTVFENLFVFFIIKCYLDSLFTIAKIAQVYIVSRILSSNNARNFMLSYAVILTISFAAVFLFMKYSMKKLISETTGMIFWKYIWCVPVTSYLVYQFGISPNYRRTYDILERTRIFLPLIWITGTFLTFVILIQMLTVTAEAEKEAGRLRVMNQQMTLMEVNYRKMRQGIEEGRRAKHDLHHQVLTLKECFEKRDYEKMKLYLDELSDCHGTIEYGETICENYSVDAVAGHYLGAAKEQGIDVDVSIQVPENLSFQESDIGIVFGNLLENAFEACMRQKQGRRYIRVRADFTSSSVLGIVVENSYDGEIREKKGVFFSSKREGEGIGVNSICNIAEKYHGVTKFEYSNGVFKASVLLNGT